MVKPETRARFPSPSALADSPSRSAGAPPFPGSAPGLGAAQLPGLQAKPSHSGYPEGDAATSRCAPETPDGGAELTPRRALLGLAQPGELRIQPGDGLCGGFPTGVTGRTTG